MPRYPEYRYTVYIKAEYVFSGVDDDETALKAISAIKMILLGDNTFPSSLHDGVKKKITKERLEKKELFRYILDKDGEYVSKRIIPIPQEEKPNEEAPRGVCCYVDFDERRETPETQKKTSTRSESDEDTSHDKSR